MDTRGLLRQPLCARRAVMSGCAPREALRTSVWDSLGHREGGLAPIRPDTTTAYGHGVSLRYLVHP
jgi:hypothetical protein